ncbi:hypothetical protein AYO45_01035 [Gammaproteobacteria bacterium SCGC AG-212-F23]|nr:hypothetical protein AYO45_01035 [Gammaproteobacteria bacterium SCGC AG-212-F23]
MSNPLNEVAYCVEYFYAKPGFRDQLVQSLLKLVEPTRAEPGCLQYDLLQDQKDENLIILLVKFKNIELMNKHEHQAFVKAFAENEMKKYCEKLIWNDALGISK